MAYYLWAVSNGWNGPITDRHSLRQTQTAITAYYMVREPFKLAYDTPIFGRPWPVPYEFPLYQWLVAGFVRTFGFPLDQTGRALSVAFYLLTLIPAYFLLGAFRVASPNRLLVLCLMLVSPFYIFWSRTFMIETCALFFSLAYAAAALEVLIRPRGLPMIFLACACGCIAALVKITTFIPFCALTGLFAFRDFLRMPFPFLRAAKGPLGLSVLFVGAPMAAGMAWTRFADHIKDQNPIANYLTSSALFKWNFGTFQQKTSLAVWVAILRRAPTLFFGLPRHFTLVSHHHHAAVLLLGLLSVLLLSACIACYRRLKPALLTPMLPAGFIRNPRFLSALVCAALFISAPAIFTNLHFIHDYYMCANGLFLIGAVAFIIIGLLEIPSLRFPGIALVAIAMLAGIYGHCSLYLPIQTKSADALPAFARHVRDVTSGDAVNVLVNLNSTIPYYSERRSLEISPWVTIPELHQAFENLRGDKIGLILYVPNKYFSQQTIVEMMKTAGLQTNRFYVLTGRPETWSVHN